MKTLAFCLIAVLGLTLLPSARANDHKVGDTRFIAYEGKQGSWPTADHAQVIKDFAVPIYFSVPEKSYRILGRIYDPRTTGVGVVGRAFAEGLFPERDRQRDCANQAHSRGADAVLVTDEATIVKAWGLSSDEIEKTAPLLNHKDKIVLAIKFR